MFRCGFEAVHAPMVSRPRRTMVMPPHDVGPDEGPLSGQCLGDPLRVAQLPPSAATTRSTSDRIRLT